LSIDAAVLDTPYGRSAKIMALSKELLLQESLRELFRVILLGRRMAIVADRSIEGLIEWSLSYLLGALHVKSVLSLNISTEPEELRLKSRPEKHFRCKASAGEKFKHLIDD
jgi:tRNA G10  N-methylase Trm11